MNKQCTPAVTGACSPPTTSGSRTTGKQGPKLRQRGARIAVGQPVTFKEAGAAFVFLLYGTYFSITLIAFL